MEIIRKGKVLPGYHTDVFSTDIIESPEFSNLCVYTLPIKLIEAIQLQQPGLFSTKQIEKELEIHNNYPNLIVVLEKYPIAQPASKGEMNLSS